MRGFMKHAFGMGSVAMMYKPSFMKSGSDHLKFTGAEGNTGSRRIA
jgi:hypothetical protein